MWLKEQPTRNYMKFIFLVNRTTEHKSSLPVIYFRVKRKFGSKMYESSCSYQTALDLKRAASPLITHQVKSEDCLGLTQCATDWGSYRFHQSTFEQLKQSVEKAKAALQDRTVFLGSSSAFR